MVSGFWCSSYVEENLDKRMSYNAKCCLMQPKYIYEGAEFLDDIKDYRVDERPRDLGKVTLKWHNDDMVWFLANKTPRWVAKKKEIETGSLIIYDADNRSILAWMLFNTRIKIPVGEKLELRFREREI